MKVTGVAIFPDGVQPGIQLTRLMGVVINAENCMGLETTQAVGVGTACLSSAESLNFSPH